MRHVASSYLVAWCICEVTTLCKTAERIEVLFGLETWAWAKARCGVGHYPQRRRRGVDVAIGKLFTLTSC